MKIIVFLASSRCLVLISWVHNQLQYKIDIISGFQLTDKKQQTKYPLVISYNYYTTEQLNVPLR